MTRRCSQCSNNGHNLRTCPARSGGVRIFGVRLTEGATIMKKSASMSSLSCVSSVSATATAAADAPHSAGYASDDPARGSCSSSHCRAERKKGIPWTEEEHKMFLLGLQKLGKGDWRGISRNFVISRTPTQVASHAQKYFIRQTTGSRKKRRSSLFDMIPNPKSLPVHEELHIPPCPLPNEPEIRKQFPSLHLRKVDVAEPAESSSSNPPELKGSPAYNCRPAYNCSPVQMVPAFYPALIPVQFAFWPTTVVTPEDEAVVATHEVLKPTPVLRKEPGNTVAIKGMSKLSIVEGGTSRMGPSALSLKLLEDSSLGQSAFHMNPAIAEPGLSKGSSNAIHAV